MSDMESMQRRIEVERMYSGRGWTLKVRRMSDAQVFAIWKKKRKKEEEDLRKKQDPPEQDNRPF